MGRVGVLNQAVLTKGWDGTFNGKPAQQDAYVWMVFFQRKNIRQPKKYFRLSNLVALSLQRFFQQQ
jgi:hypothetical protein